VSAGERATLERLAVRFGLHSADVDTALADVKSALSAAPAA
jgi:hypothetical protein